MTRDTVLVADDDPDFRMLVRLILEESAVRVVEASAFEEAVQRILFEGVRVGLVLLDYFMPGDRELAVEELRTTVGVDRIVLCTASADASQRARELRLTRVVAKPFVIDDIREAVAATIGR